MSRFFLFFFGGAMFEIGTLVCLTICSTKHTGVVIDIRSFGDTAYLIHFIDGDFGWWSEQYLEVLCE